MGGPGICDGKKFKEFDNFYECKFLIDGVEYCSAENYFQCQKTTNEKDFKYLLNSGPGVMVWSNSRKVTLRKNWEMNKVDVMYKGNYEKFAQNEDLEKALTSTIMNIKLHDSSSFWCKWNGLILERVRAELRMNGEEDLKTIEEISNMMEEYRIKSSQNKKNLL